MSVQTGRYIKTSPDPASDVARDRLVLPYGSMVESDRHQLDAAQAG